MLPSNYNYFLFLILIFPIACNHSYPESKQSINGFNALEFEKDWPALPDSLRLGDPTGIGIDSNQNIFVFHRGDRDWPLVGSMPGSYIKSKTILMLERISGKILNRWGDNIFIMPHGLTVDANNNIWVTDVGLHQVFKFTHEGKLLMKLGEAKVPGNDMLHFNQPTDIAVSTDGSFYVSDGYGNGRIIKFSPTGKYLFQWGKKGKKEGEFNIPHGICLDEKENIYVADRENNRIQVFDSTGKFIKQWKHKNLEKSYSITFDKVNKNFIAVDDAASWLGLKHNGSGIILFNSAGDLLNHSGRTREHKDSQCLYHDVSIDKEGNIYVGDIIGNRIRKFRRLPSHY